MDCFGTYFTHVQTCNVTRVQSATECLLWYIFYTCPNLQQPTTLFFPALPNTSRYGPVGRHRWAGHGSCIAERARSIVGQLLETWNELVLIECRIFTRPSQKQNEPTQTKTEHNTPNQQTKTPTRSSEISQKDVRQRWNDLPLSAPHAISSTM